MQPLVNLMESNRNFYNFRNMQKKDPSVPEFRFVALQEKYITDMTEICRILTAFDVKGVCLQDTYDIRQMLFLLDIKDWHSCPPLFFYLHKLENTFNKTTKTLLEMHKKGPLRCHYFIERNTQLQTDVIAMTKQFVVSNWLAGDALKQDQFKFIYKIHEIVFGSALKDTYLDGKKNKVILEEVIPELTVFKAMLLIRDIDNKKQQDIVKEAEKAEQRAEMGIEVEEEDYRS